MTPSSLVELPPPARLGVAAAGACRPRRPAAAGPNVPAAAALGAAAHRAAAVRARPVVGADAERAAVCGRGPRRRLVPGAPVSVMVPRR